MTPTNRQIQRREFLRTAIAAAGGAATLPALRGLGPLAVNGRVHAAPGHGSYGPLVPTPDLRDGGVRIALPEGFRYRSFSPAGATMSDGNLVPLAHDGMGVFNMRNGRFRLVRNHEDRNSPGNGTAAIDGNAYDKKGGGTTTLVVNPFTRELERDFLSLSGTTVNCAGGVTPWESWITCEETNVGPTPEGWLKQHGYAFDVPASANGTVPAVPIPDMGRFAHEAVAVDPRTWIVYETEDNGSNSGFYRFLPHTRGVLTDGGALQMLKVDGSPAYDTRTGQTVGLALPVAWVDIPDPNPPGTSSTAVFNQGLAGGGARFARLEGCWFGNGAIYFVATNGGNASAGQVWEFRPADDRRHRDDDGDDDNRDDWDDDGRGGRWHRKGTLTLIFESSGAAQLDAPDNITVSPQNALLLCEDGGGDQYLRGVTLNGEIFDFALNLQTDSEWAGATFAVADERWNSRRIRGEHPHLGNRWDRVTLFVNRQGSTSGPTPPLPGDEGLTFAIWGPWKNGAL